MSQTEAIVAALRSAGETGITPLEALDRFGTMRLASRIHEAKDLIGPDEEIVTQPHTLPHSGKVVARYVLRSRVSRGGTQDRLWADETIR